MYLSRIVRAEKHVKAFFESEWNDEKMKIHSKCVVDACLGMVKNTDLNPVVFILAGWLHDLGKLIDKEQHHVESMKFMKKFLNNHTQYKELEEVISDCILNHRTKGNPVTIYGQIFQVADKVALYDKNWIMFKKRFKN